MSEDLWKSVDRFITDHLVPADAALDDALKASDAAGLPAINVAPNQGKLLNLLARIIGAKRVLEIGTLGGYSTIWLARALPADGKIVTLEYDPKHAEVAQKNFARAGVDGLIEVRVGKALDSLPGVETDGLGPFDLFFIDADKQNNPHYFAWALKLSHPGSVIIIDNVVRKGAIVDPENKDTLVEGVRQTYAIVGKEPRVDATAFQTVGLKGHDGLLIALVKSF